MPSKPKKKASNKGGRPKHRRTPQGVSMNAPEREMAGDIAEWTMGERIISMGIRLALIEVHARLAAAQD